MKTASFLYNEGLWHTLANRVRSARHVDAAIAYFGGEGAELLPLRRGDRLVVDMSMPKVEAGLTNPSAVERLMKRGVKAFTRSNLHAKVVLGNNFVIAGSANISGRSYRILDEAAIITDDISAIRRAREFINRLCTEPIRPNYLAACKAEYNPPTFNGSRGQGRGKRAMHAKLWIANLREYPIPQSELKRFEVGVGKATKLRTNKTSSVDSFHWLTKPRMESELVKGDWVIQVVKYNNGELVVYPPAQFLFTDSYTRDKKSQKKRYVFHLEGPPQEQTLTWKAFRRHLPSSFSAGQRPRTMPIRNTDTADKLLRLWTETGRLSRIRP